jgi:Tol biopolymer transport system component
VLPALIALIALVALGCAYAAPVATATLSGQNGRILFTSSRDGNREIYVMNSDGSAESNVTQNPASDDWPTSLKPGGFSGFEHPATFASNRNGDYDLFRISVPNLNLSPYQTGPGNQTQPAYGEEQTVATAWVGDEEGNQEIYIHGPQGVERLTNDPAADTAPAVRAIQFPKVLFVSNRDGNEEIYMYDVMEDPPHPLTRLTYDPASDGAPNWSPDGQKIAFETNRDGNYEVYVMNADGTGATNISNHPSSDREPAWSPDGTKIVFQSLRDGDFEIYSMAADGSDQTRLTNSAGGDLNPDWAPYGFHGYPRPKGATPLRASLVPAYSACTAPNRTHGSPLAFSSCNPPLQTSGFLTIGTPDANGAPAKSTGYADIRVDAVPPENLIFEFVVQDVRCSAAVSPSVCTGANAADGPDYSGNVQFRLTIRRTDRQDGSPADDPSTMVDHVLEVNAGCANTPDTTIGAFCGVATMANAIVPGIVQDQKRSTWELDRIRVYDTGADGSASTAGDETLFMTQGIFIP